jgi:hypothetical protein
MRFLKILRQTTCCLTLLLAATGLVHLLGAAGFLVGGPLLALAGYFIGTALLASVLVWASERV